MVIPIAIRNFVFLKTSWAIFESYSIANPRNTSVLLWVGSIATSKYDPNLLPEKTKFRIAMGIGASAHEHGLRLATSDKHFLKMASVDVLLIS